MFTALLQADQWGCRIRERPSETQTHQTRVRASEANMHRDSLPPGKPKATDGHARATALPCHWHTHTRTRMERVAGMEKERERKVKADEV